MNTQSLYRAFVWVSILSLILSLGMAGDAGAQSGPGSEALPVDSYQGPGRQTVVAG